MADWNTGYIIDFNEEEIVSILSKEYQLDLRLTSYRNKLRNIQNQMVCEGAIVRYDISSGKLEFLAENGLDWI